MLLASLAGELISTKFIPTEGNCFTPHPSNKLWLLRSEGEIQNTIVVEIYLKKFFFSSFYIVSKILLSKVLKVLLSNPYKSQTGSKNTFSTKCFSKEYWVTGPFWPPTITTNDLKVCHATRPNSNKYAKMFSHMFTFQQFVQLLLKFSESLFTFSCP